MLQLGTSRALGARRPHFSSVHSEHEVAWQAPEIQRASSSPGQQQRMASPPLRLWWEPDARRASRKMNSGFCPLRKRIAEQRAKRARRDPERVRHWRTWPKPPSSPSPEQARHRWTWQNPAQERHQWTWPKPPSWPNPEQARHQWTWQNPAQAQHQRTWPKPQSWPNPEQARHRRTWQNPAQAQHQRTWPRPQSSLDPERVRHRRTWSCYLSRRLAWQGSPQIARKARLFLLPNWSSCWRRACPWKLFARCRA